MKYLLDTHTFIWWDSDATKLSATVLALCRDRNNILLLSLASVWEMQIKLKLGKLKLPTPLADIIQHQQDTNRFELLAIKLSHILALENIPAHHKDPFDHLLITQAQTEDVTLLSDDPLIAKYPIQVIW